MDKNYFRQKLEGELERLEKEVGHYRTEDPYLSKDRPSENTDDSITEIEEHDRLKATQVELEKNLKEVKDALGRIEKGTYGICENKGEKINTERLDIMPTARYCLSCQQLKKKA